MLTKISISSGVQEDKEIRFLLAETPESSLGTPSGKMITDSDKLTFVYLFDEEEDYRHIHFPQAIWPLMVAALDSDTDPVISWDDQSVTLLGFREELEMLIFNIEGNNNYGEEFSLAVEQAFAEKLQSTE